jgi:hypothetical protein
MARSSPSVSPLHKRRRCSRSQESAGLFTTRPSSFTDRSRAASRRNGPGRSLLECPQYLRRARAAKEARSHLDSALRPSSGWALPGGLIWPSGLGSAPGPTGDGCCQSWSPPCSCCASSQTSHSASAGHRRVVRRLGEPAGRVKCFREQVPSPARQRNVPGAAVLPVAAPQKMTVVLPSRTMRSSQCQRTARDSTARSTSAPRRTRSAVACRWSTRTTSCSMIGPWSRSWVT